MMFITPAATINPYAKHLQDAIQEAIAVLGTTPSVEHLPCDGCRCEWEMALDVLKRALEPTGFVQVAGGEWVQMQKPERPAS